MRVCEMFVCVHNRSTRYCENFQITLHPATRDFKMNAQTQRGYKYSMNSRCYYRFNIGSTRRGSRQGRSRTSGPVSFQIIRTPLC